MLSKIDNLLDSITMYRLTLYYLIFLLVIAFILSFLHLLPFAPLALIISTAILLGICYASNKLFEKIFKIQTNTESLYITALILALIITPDISLRKILILCLAALLSMVSKYIINIKGKHIFNPAAIAVFITGITVQGYASWWVGTASMLPFVLLGILIVRKIRRIYLLLYFLISILVVNFIFGLSQSNVSLLLVFKRIFYETPILFFAFVMLTEPLTTPPTKFFQSIYGIIVGALLLPQAHIGNIYSTPELALLVGNVFSYLVSPKQKLTLFLKEKIKLTDSVYDFIFSSSEKLNFHAGQYLEWTLGHKGVDSRGNRRYLTVASSPTENEIRIGVKFPNHSSSFKQEMLRMKKGSKIIASQLSGEFTLPKEKNKKLAFIAGGIGITPFRSIIKYLIDTNEKRDIILIYSEKEEKDLVYKDIFDESKKKLGIQIHYVKTSVVGRVNENMIKEAIPDYKTRNFYLSGPHEMVTSFEKILSDMKLPKNRIKVDYFPGF